MTYLYLTTKQVGIINALKRLNDDGSFLDLDQLLNKLPYRTTKQSLQFSLRALIEHGLVMNHRREVRRERRRRVLSLTTTGYKRMGFGADLEKIEVAPELM